MWFCQNSSCAKVKRHKERGKKMYTINNFLEFLARHASNFINYYAGFLYIALAAAAFIVLVGWGAMLMLVLRRKKLTRASIYTRFVTVAWVISTAVLGAAAAISNSNGAMYAVAIVLVLVVYAAVYALLLVVDTIKFRVQVRNEVKKILNQKNPSAVSPMAFEQAMSYQIPRNTNAVNISRLSMLVDDMLQKKTSEYALREVLRTLESAQKTEYLSPENNKTLQENIDKVKSAVN